MPLDTIAIAIISALFGAGGISAITRARGQNKTDASATLNTGQIAFNQQLIQRINDLEAQASAREASDKIRDAQYDEMIRLTARLGAENQIKDAQIVAREETIERQNRQIESLEKKVNMLERREQELTTRVAVLERQIEGGAHVAP